MEGALDGQLVDNFVELVEHEAAHAGKLRELLDRSTCAGDGGDRERVDLGQTVDDLLTDLVVRVRPELDQLCVISL